MHSCAALPSKSCPWTATGTAPNHGPIISSSPFWVVNNGLLHPYPRLREDVRCDVLIVGAGIIGALIGDHLAFMAGMLLPLRCGGGQTDPKEPGPMEQAGEAVDEAADDIGDTAEEGVDKTGDAIGEAGDEVDEATEEKPVPAPPDE